MRMFADWVILIVVGFAVLQITIGGLRDFIKRDSIIPSMHHAFSDGIFFILLAIFMVLFNKS